MDQPPAGALLRALEQLLALGALGADGRLTQPLGRRMARLPVEPAFAKARVNALFFLAALIRSPGLPRCA